MNQEEFQQIRRQTNSVRNSFEDLERMLEFADQFEVDASTDPGVADRHQAFLEELEQFYFQLEDVLSRADRIENADGETVRELPGNVPDFVQDRVNNRPENPGQN